LSNAELLASSGHVTKRKHQILDRPLTLEEWEALDCKPLVAASSRHRREKNNKPARNFATMRPALFDYRVLFSSAGQSVCVAYPRLPWAPGANAHGAWGSNSYLHGIRRELYNMRHAHDDDEGGACLPL